MIPIGRLRETVEVGLAVFVFVVVAMESGYLPRPYPAWPTVAGLPANPELVVPALLGVVALVGVVRDGVSVGAIAVGVLAVLTVFMAVEGVHELRDDSCGCLFVAGFFTAILGTVLATTVIARNVVRRTGFDGISYWIRRFDRY